MIARGPRIISRDFAVAVGRFRPEGVVGYRAKSPSAAPLRATRDEAIADELRWLDFGVVEGVTLW